MATLPSARYEPVPRPPAAVIPLPQRGISEDWLAVGIGLLVFVLSLGLLFGVDLLGWAVTTSVWTNPAKALAPTSNLSAHLPPSLSLIATYVFLLISPRAYDALKEAIQPELYIKTAIVILGGFLGIAALEQRQLATSIMFLGACAIIAAYLIYWPIVYYVDSAGD